MQPKYCEILKKTKLFSKTSEKTIKYAIDLSTVSSCEKNDCLFDSSKNAPALYVIIDGNASVYGNSKNQPVILNNLSAGMIFGMASLFGDKCESTKIIAKNTCTYATLPQECVEKLLSTDSVFAKNYICFLSEKIRFLNQKIAFFTSENTEKKLMGYILSLPYNSESGYAKLDTNMTKLSQKLDIGRASLYRAFDSLEEKNLIKRKNNIVYISSYDDFKNIYHNTNGESL